MGWHPECRKCRVDPGSGPVPCASHTLEELEELEHTDAADARRGIALARAELRRAAAQVVGAGR
jgi:hypothetical protein